MAEWNYGSIHIRSNRAEEPGPVIDGHAHNFDHTSIFWPGRWRVQKRIPLVDSNGDPLIHEGQQACHVVKDVTRDGPFYLPIEASAWHRAWYLGNPVPEWMEPFLELLPADKREEFQAKWAAAAGEMWCVYSHRNPRGEVVPEPTGWMDAYA